MRSELIFPNGGRFSCFLPMNPRYAFFYDLNCAAMYRFFGDELREWEHRESARFIALTQGWLKE